jgi:hypothetical protein
MVGKRKKFENITVGEIWPVQKYVYWNKIIKKEYFME